MVTIWTWDYHFRYQFISTNLSSFWTILFKGNKMAVVQQRRRSSKLFKGMSKKSTPVPARISNTISECTRTWLAWQRSIAIRVPSVPTRLWIYLSGGLTWRMFCVTLWMLAAERSVSMWRFKVCTHHIHPPYSQCQIYNSNLFLAHFKSDIMNSHCQHIVFCGSADNGYARILDSHRESNRISLVEGPPFAHELRALVPYFKTASFPTVFRSKKLLSRRVSFGGTSTTPAITPPRTPTPNYASIAKTPVEEIISTTNSPTDIRKSNNPKLIVCKNASGHRVDPYLRFSSKSKIEDLKQHKFCNQFHILGWCSYGEGCTHKHKPKLVGQDVLDLMWIARLSLCPKGLGCDDENCVSGHRCPQKTCTVQGCKFPHNVDTKIVAHG